MNIAAACQRDVATARSDATLTQAAALMRERHVGSVVVIDPAQGKPVGIVTDRDIVVEVVAAGLDPREMTVSEIMSAPLVTAHPGDDATQTLKAMHVRGIRRVPVIDDDGFLVGIASLDDLLELASEVLGDAVGAIRNERSLESWMRRRTGA